VIKSSRLSLLVSLKHLLPVQFVRMTLFRRFRRRSLGVSTAAAEVNDSSSTLVFAPRPFLSLSFDNKLCADTSIDSERLKVPILPLFALRLNAPRQNRLQGGHFDRWGGGGHNGLITDCARDVEHRTQYPWLWESITPPLYYLLKQLCSSTAAPGHLTWSSGIAFAQSECI